MKAAEFQTSERLRCMLCGGAKCKRCGSTAYLQQERRGLVPALPRTHSSWVTSDIVGMQRPNNALLREGLLQAFAQHNIRCIFNLTRPGEHPHCGTLRMSAAAVAPALPPESAAASDHSGTTVAKGKTAATRIGSSKYIDTYGGFPYDPELVMAAGIGHYNYSWPDMTTPTMALMRHIVQVACGELRRGHRLAVHCHAGFGRTGIAICCILLARDFCGPRAAAADEAIALVRAGRPGSVQTAKQARFVRSFQDELCRAHALFPTPGDEKKSFEQSASDDNFCYGTCSTYSAVPFNAQPALPPTLALLLDALRRWVGSCGLAAHSAAAQLFLREEGSGGGAAAEVISHLAKGDPSSLLALLSALEPSSPHSDGSAAAAALLRVLSQYLCTRSEALASAALLQRIQISLSASGGVPRIAARAAEEACRAERPARRWLLLALANALPPKEELLRSFSQLLGAGRPAEAEAAGVLLAALASGRKEQPQDAAASLGGASASQGA